VPALTGPIASVEVEIDLIHPWAGDVTAILIAPDSTGHTLFGRVLASTGPACGSSSNFNGTYAFHDLANPPHGGLWQAATAVGTGDIPPGEYRTTNAGGAGATNPMPPTSLDAPFAGMTAGEAQGQWILRVIDSSQGDLGEVNAARLKFWVAGPSDRIFDNGFENLLPVH